MKLVLTPEIGALIGLLVNALILAVVTSLTPIIKRLVMAKVEQIAAALGEQRVLTLTLLAHQVVKFAEQAGITGVIEDTAEAKLQLAEDTIKKLAESVGITNLKPEEWRSAIEAAIREGAHKRFEPPVFEAQPLTIEAS
jgi:hypothetical protein